MAYIDKISNEQIPSPSSGSSPAPTTLLNGATRNAEPVGSESTIHDVPYSQGQINKEVLDKYGSGDITTYMGDGAVSQLSQFLNRSDVPEDRKQALLAQMHGLVNQLPENSPMDKFSSFVIGTSNYQKAMQKLSGELGTLLSNAINANYEEHYNSAPAQSDRQRSAGVNSDLAGLSGDASGQATDTNEMAPSYPGLSEPIEPSTFMDVAMQGVQIITGFVGQIQGWISNDINNATAEVMLDNQVRENVRNTFASVIQDKDQLDMETFKFVRDYYNH